jgi:selenium-binding protein 1
VPGAPLEVRWALEPQHHYAFTTTALTSKIWLSSRKDDGTFAAEAVGDVGDPKKVPLPVDISISLDDRFLFVDTFMDGMCRVYDVSNPPSPEAGCRAEDRRAGEHGLAELDRRARVFHLADG